jgi:hypothetical protein
VLLSGGVAAAAVAAALVPSVASSYGGELAALIRLYWQQVDEYNTMDHYSDEHSDRHAAATYERTMRLMVGVPARNAEDALTSSRRVAGRTWFSMTAMRTVLIQAMTWTA